MYDVDIK